ncbi:hypothetical protein DUNSADRAFT_11601 [Dunaliella salina]|uniref:Encoded protein n=1 Tax=Dunaliella salina TaxID=3046 RepID=A0ABQ7GD21_DUNSA|nr:hypothetical protein DUNSADRAFT_11601 [Dunaliella salina]|eukprot:KAF5832501.1 hypothetical protein DUNSADRAFT_11601 [Dunaliella salina]
MTPLGCSCTYMLCAQDGGGRGQVAGALNESSAAGAQATGGGRGGGRGKGGGKGGGGGPRDGGQQAKDTAPSSGVVESKGQQLFRKQQAAPKAAQGGASTANAFALLMEAGDE